MDQILDTKNVYHKPPFSGHSHKRPKIKFQRLLYLTSFGTAKWCVIIDVFGAGLLQQHHLPRKDVIACLEAVVKATEHLLPSLEAQVCKC